MEQQFSLTWNNFHGNLSKGFAGLLGKGEFVDVTIAVEGHLIQAHKVILSICSPYFKKMFQMNPCQHPIVVLRDVTHKAMQDLLQFMYHGEVSVKREDLTSFIGTAEVLQIKGLTNKEVEDDDDMSQKDELPNCSVKSQNKNLPNVDSCVSDVMDNHFIENVGQSDMNILKQRDLLERLQNLSNFKRKSEEFLQKTFYNADLLTQKRPKLKDIPAINKNLNTTSNNYENICNVYDEVQKDISTNFVPHLKHSNQNPHTNQELFEKNHSCELSPDEVPIDLKTECEDNDILTETAVSTHLQNYEAAKERSDYSTVQENVSSFKALFAGLKHHHLTTIPQKEDGKKKYPQRSCRLCWKIGKRRDTRFMCRALSLVMNGSCESQLPSRYKYIYSRKGHKQLVHMNFVYTKHSTSHGKTSWRCVQYFSLNRCPATVETIDSMIYTVNHQHNHEDCYEKLSKNNIYEMNVE